MVLKQGLQGGAKDAIPCDHGWAAVPGATGTQEPTEELHEVITVAATGHLPDLVLRIVR